MRQRRLGTSDLSVSVVGLGCNNFGGRINTEKTRSVVDAAIEAGINFLDTADIYGNQGGSESALGEVLEGRRDQVIIATKFGGDMGDGAADPRASASYIRHAVEESLRRLRTDYIDLYQLHFPDGETPFAETLGALTELVSEGKVRYIGSSNFEAAQILDADRVAEEGQLEHFVSAQNHYNLLHRDVEPELLAACTTANVGVLPYFPLASGLLTGKYQRGAPPPPGSRLAKRPDDVAGADFDTIDRLTAFAAERSHSLLDIAIAGLLSRPVVSSVISGATTAEQVQANAAAGEWDLSAADAQALDETLAGIAAA